MVITLHPARFQISTVLNELNMNIGGESHLCSLCPDILSPGLRFLCN